jgi:hypothetical protein
METYKYINNILNIKLINNDYNLVKNILLYLKCKKCSRLNISNNKCICSYRLCILCKIKEKKTNNYYICDQDNIRWLNHHTQVLCKKCHNDIKRKKKNLPQESIFKCDMCGKMICIDCQCHKSQFYTYCYDCYYN